MAPMLETLLKSIPIQCSLSRVVVASLKKVFIHLDRHLREMNIGNSCGSTATVLLVSPDILYVANCGDSRTMAVLRDGTVERTRDHKPCLPAEVHRILSAGESIS